jgi:hypothetical protein
MAHGVPAALIFLKSWQFTIISTGRSGAMKTLPALHFDNFLAHHKER